jgi:hypothetical protein
MIASKPDPILYLSDARGVYIPRDFALGTRRECITGLSNDVLPILEAGPEHELYWDAWTCAETNARVTDPQTGVVYSLWQDGDLWLIPDGMEWCEETQGFAWTESEAQT